jgi:UDP-3-O-[3-hydroxymyristoyl] glucosamine N-acyltransferase
MNFTLAELAAGTGARLHGDGNCRIRQVAEISSAGEGSIAYVYNPRYVKYLKSTGASAVIVTEELLDSCPAPALVTPSPRLIFARVAAMLNPTPMAPAGISSGAVVAADANVDSSACVEAGAIVGSGARIDAGAWVGPGCVIETGAMIGQNTRLRANVTIGSDCILGDNNIVHAGVVIGADGFGFELDGEAWCKIPQLGRVRIGNDVEIGANTTIDRGSLGDTVIGDGVKIDNQIQIGHNVRIGNHTVISACTCIAGSTKIGSHCLIGGSVGIRDNIEITDNVIITGRTLVSRSITRAGSYSSSTPMDETANWRRNAARFRQLDELARRLKKLETEHENSDGHGLSVPGETSDKR